VSPLGVMRRCGVGRSTQGNQQAQGQNKAHPVRSLSMPCPIKCAPAITDPSRNDFKISQICEITPAGGLPRVCSGVRREFFNGMVIRSDRSSPRWRGIAFQWSRGGPFARKVSS
jgi:hypothetical protein